MRFDFMFFEDISIFYQFVIFEYLICNVGFYFFILIEYVVKLCVIYIYDVNCNDVEL